MDEPTADSILSRGWTFAEMNARRLQMISAASQNNNASRLTNQETGRNDPMRHGRLEREAFEAAKNVLQRRRENLKRCIDDEKDN